MTILNSLFGEIGSYIFILLVDVLVIYLVVSFFKSRRRYKAGTILDIEGKSANDILDEMELEEVSMRLNYDEACYYEGIATAYHTKNIVTGYRRNSSGYSVRAMKGVSLHNSSGTSNAIRKTISTPYPGRLFITNERIVFLAEKYGFDIDFNKLSNISVYNKYLEVFAGSKFYRLYTKDTLFIRDLITLMNQCYEEKQSLNNIDDSIDNQAEIESFSYENKNDFEIYEDDESSIRFLWENGSKKDWEKALKHYYETLGTEQISIEKYIENLNANEIKTLAVTEFYNFLYDKYFVWKYTQKNRLATTRKSLKRYIDEDKLSSLAEIQNKLFTMNHNNIEQCLNEVTKIHGLGAAGASGLLAILFPQKFGTIDQFVAKRLKELNIPKYENELHKMNPDSLKISDGVILIEIMKDKANELNRKFNTEFWTPRKIDMILWSIGR